MILETEFRIRGRSPNQENIKTRFYTLKDMINYAIERGFEIESIDQYVGKDNGSNALFENDIIKTLYNKTYDFAYYQIIWSKKYSAFWCKCIALHHKENGFNDISKGGFCEGYFHNEEEAILIGNLYDNPELFHKYEMDGDYVNISNVSSLLEMQNQYLSNYLDLTPKYLKFSDGIRTHRETKGNYHSIMIHKEDVEEFIRRVREHRSGN